MQVEDKVKILEIVYETTSLTSLRIIWTFFFNILQHINNFREQIA